MMIWRHARSAIAATVSVALFATTAATAVADDTTTSTSHPQRIEQIVDSAQARVGIKDPAPQISPSTNAGELNYESSKGSSSVAVNETGITFAPLASGDTTGLFSLEDNSVGADFSTTPDGSAVLSGDDKDYVVDSYDNGSLRVQTVIASADANHKIPFELNLQDDEKAQVETDGSIGIYRVFEDEGTQLLTSSIEKPWAVDAAGKPVQTKFVLDGTRLIQIVEADATAAYPITADPFWVPAIIVGLRVGVQVLIKVGPRVVKYVVAPGSRVVNALRKFAPITFRAGSNVVRLDKSAMKHILQRHHPQYWNGTKKSTQSFFNPKMSVSDVRATIHGALRQHASSLRKLGSKAGTYTGTYNGVKYKLVVSKGRVVQFYPR